MAMIDLIIAHATVITMERKGLGVIENGAVGIDGNRIAIVDDSEVVQREYSAHRTMDASHKVVMPGLIDTHIHSGLGILRGVAQDTDNWMEKGLWPFMQFLTDDQRQAGSLVNIIEGLKAGTTTFGDYNGSMNDIVQNHITLGTRAHVCDMINEMPDRMGDTREVGELYPLDPAVGEKKLQENLALIKNYHGSENGRITCHFGPQGPDMMSKELLLEVKNLAKKFDTSIHMHVAQGDREIDQMVKRYGKRSIPYLEEIGYLDERLMAVHLTEATPEETKTVARSGAAMLLCSGSIGIIDGIVPPAAEFLETSDRFALGSDQAPGNNCNNMFNEMKFTSILNKCRHGDPRAFPAWQMLKSVTINAAQAIGLGDDIGSLKPGKKADMIILDLQSPSLFPTIQAPIRNIVPNLVYSANGSEVETVIIDGQVVVDEKVVQTADEHQALVDGQQHANELASQVRGVDTPLAQMMADGLL